MNNATSSRDSCFKLIILDTSCLLRGSRLLRGALAVNVRLPSKRGRVRVGPGSSTMWPGSLEVQQRSRRQAAKVRKENALQTQSAQLRRHPNTKLSFEWVPVPE